MTLSTCPRFVIANSMCHDADLLLLMFPSASVRVDAVERSGTHESTLTARMTVTLPDSGYSFPARIDYTKGMREGQTPPSRKHTRSYTRTHIHTCTCMHAHSCTCTR